MRTIKFRGISIGAMFNGGWVVGDLHSDDSYFNFNSRGLAWYTFKDWTK